MSASRLEVVRLVRRPLSGEPKAPGKTARAVVIKIGKSMMLNERNESLVGTNVERNKERDDFDD